ncbi:MAG: DUF2335 domain-containing protein [Hyphomicrobiales bacterium]
MKKPPVKKPKQQVRTTQEVAISKSWSGPLPHPETLAEFDRVIPNGAERIVNAWEKETAHRHKIDRKELNVYAIETILGKLAALIFVLAALGVATFATYIGQPWVAAVLGMGTISSVVWALVTIRRK